MLAPEAEDMELAWQMLEISRIGYAKVTNDPARRQKLADVYSRLGDHSQMNGSYLNTLMPAQSSMTPPINRRRALERRSI